jgi:hypothetical protein
LYEKYQAWCREHHLQPSASKQFGQICKNEIEISFGLRCRHDLQVRGRLDEGAARSGAD